MSSRFKNEEFFRVAGTKTVGLEQGAEGAPGLL